MSKTFNVIILILTVACSNNTDDHERKARKLKECTKLLTIIKNGGPHYPPYDLCDLNPYGKMCPCEK